MLGTIFKINARGFGFIKPREGAEQSIFFHAADLRDGLVFGDALVERIPADSESEGPTRDRCQARGMIVKPFTAEIQQRLLHLQERIAGLTVDLRSLESQRDTLIRQLTDSEGAHDQRSVGVR